MNKPKALKQGDTIGLIAPSSPVSHPDRVGESVRTLEEYGFKVVVGDSCLGTYGYLAHTDDVRAGDVNRMFADPSIDGIVCIKGGYGTPRIVDKLHYDVIKLNPKPFIGYSDITALHIVLNQLCDMVTFHGPMPASDMLSGFDNFSKESFMNALTETEPLGELHNPPGEEIKSLVSGKASGTILGGNLSLLVATIGSPYEIDTRGKLLFIEEIDEEPYRVDRMLNQLRLAGKFDECSGIIIGDWNNCEPQDPTKPSLTLMEIFQDLIVPCGKPTIYNVKAGHCEPKISIPFGVEALLDADACTLTMKESALING